MLILRLIAFTFLVIIPLEVSLGSADADHSTLKWNFYYGKLLLMKGEEGTTGQAQLKVGESVRGELLVTLVHPGEEPGASTLTVHNDSGEVFEYRFEEQQPVDAFTPTVGTGSHFIIPIAEVLGSVTEGHSTQLDFYYSTSGNDKYHISSITCIIQ